MEVLSCQSEDVNIIVGTGRTATNSCTNKSAIENCLKTFNFVGNRNYYHCFDKYKCKLNPNSDTEQSRRMTFYSVDKLNDDKKRHVAVVKIKRKDLLLGFENMYGGGDRDYNDGTIN